MPRNPLPRLLSENTPLLRRTDSQLSHRTRRDSFEVAQSNLAANKTPSTLSDETLIEQDRSESITVEPQHPTSATSPPANHDNKHKRNGYAKIDEERPADPNLKLIIPAVSVGIFLVALDSTIILATYPRIGTDLKSLNLTSWIASSYFLSLTSFQPLYGKLSDIFGRKECLLFAYTIFGIGSLCCGLSQNIYQLIAARLFQGIGGGGMTTVVSIIFSDVVPLKDRGIWQGVTNVLYAAGAASGAPLGGMVADLTEGGWRWAFLAQAPVCLVAILVVGLGLRLPARTAAAASSSSSSPPPPPPSPPSAQHHPRLSVHTIIKRKSIPRIEDTAPTVTTPEPSPQTWIQKLKRIDFPGAITLVIAISLLTLGLDRGSNTSYSHPIAYIPLLLSLLLFFPLFVYIETKISPEPFTPPHIIFSRTTTPSYMCYFFSFGAWISVLYYLPLYYQTVSHTSSATVGLFLLPGTFASVSGSLIGGLIMRKYGRYSTLTTISYTLMLAGTVPIILCSNLLTNSAIGISIGLGLFTFGNGAGQTTSLTALLAATQHEPGDQAIATASSYLFRSLGNVIGVSLASTLVQSTLRHQLNSTLNDNHGRGGNAAEIERQVRQSLDYINHLDPKLQVIVRESYAWSVRFAFLLAAILVTGAILASLCVRETKPENCNNVNSSVNSNGKGRNINSDDSIRSSNKEGSGGAGVIRDGDDGESGLRKFIARRRDFDRVYSWEGEGEGEVDTDDEYQYNRA